MVSSGRLIEPLSAEVAEPDLPTLLPRERTTMPQTAQASPAASSAAGADRSFFGHPRGLSTLFFTEMWERFSYYGMRALLLLFMTATVQNGGLGWDAAKAGPIYGLYTAMVYLTALPGGWIADRFLGPRRSVLYGGIIIACGHLALTLHGVTTFFLGLCLIVIGTGLLKPNISTMVGGLYTQDDNRRDAGFSLFYMGINLGAFLAPLVCGFLAQSQTFKDFLSGLGIAPESSWHWGFGAATVGMTLGVIQYALGGRRLGNVGIEAPGRTAARTASAEPNRSGLLFLVGAVVVLAVLLGVLHATGAYLLTFDHLTQVFFLVLPFVYFGYLFLMPGFTTVERKRMAAILLLFLFATLFWSAFEQAGSTFNLFADRFTRNSIFGWSFPSSWFQSVNSAFLWILAPVFAWLWLTLARRDREPSSPTKFAFALFCAGAGFLVLRFAALASGPQGFRVSPAWLLTVYALHTIGELCLSPVGLSTMTKLAPIRVTSQMMGIWFLATSVGNFIGGQVAGLFEKLSLPNIFGAVFWVCMGFTAVAVILIRPIQRMMSGVK
jgi:proton-dependent oligopeptide transporter, POT family